MRAALFRAHGGPEVLQVAELPDPPVGPGQVAVRPRAVALNHIDLWLRRGLPKLKIPLPHVGGADICGEVVECGEGVDSVQVGQRVVVNPVLSCGHCELCQTGRDNHCAKYGLIGESQWGGACERIVIPSISAIPAPEGVDDTVLAAVPVAFMTAWHMLVDRAQIERGQSVLVWAGGSGLGMAAIQIAQMFGARVIATASTADKRKKLEEIGVPLALDPSDPDLVKVVREHTGGPGADVVFEHTGAATFPASVRAAAKGGRIVTCGSTSGPKTELDIRHVFWRQLSILGATMAPRGRLHRILAHVGDGGLKPRVDRVLPLANIAEAHRILEARTAFGKIVLSV